jgi:predicted DNA-binding ribbon-helix-helix protein
MKVRRDGKEHDYDYTLVHMKGDLHKKLKSLATDEKITMTKLIAKAIEVYEDKR